MSQNGIFDLTGKKALITGGSSGLGRAFCEAMAEYGADVAFVGRDEAKIAETARLIKALGRQAVPIKADISVESEVQRMVKEAVAGLGRIDIFFNNAGIAKPAKRIHETPTEDWDQIININLRGAWLCLKYVLAEMVKTKGGSIINISSMFGLRAAETAPSAYGASKAALINLTEVAAMQYVKDGIRVNTIAPGFHKSDLGHPRGNEPARLDFAGDPEKMLEEHCRTEVPMGRLAEASELKGLAVLLASNASSYITGQTFVQDGGMSARL